MSAYVEQGPGKPGHVTVSEITGEMRCARCGKSIILKLWNAPMSGIVRAEEAFRRKHEACAEEGPGRG